MRAALLALPLLFLLPAEGADVYRCVTENGVVRYSDTPCRDGENEKLDIESRPTDDAAVEARTRQRKEQIADLNEAEAEARKARQEAQQETEKREQACKAARERLQQLQVARRVVTGEGEERRYLESAEIEERRQEAERKVAELCGD